MAVVAGEVTEAGEDREVVAMAEEADGAHRVAADMDRWAEEEVGVNKAAEDLAAGKCVKMAAAPDL